jgi:hypothetical protein
MYFDPPRIVRTVLAAAACCLWLGVCYAQELTPRAYWPAPKGTKVAVFGYSRSSGDVLFDPSTPLYGVDSRVNAGVAAVLQTLSLWGRTTNVVVELPYTWGTTEGLVGETPASSYFSGFADIRATLAVNLLGAPSMTPSEFQELRADPRHMLGASLKVVAPTGKHDSSRLINAGSNRWAARAELGYIYPVKPRWLLEFDLGVWFYSDDDDFLPGKLEQEPVFAGRLHVVRRFKRPGFWASLDLTHFTGGRHIVGGDQLEDTQRNSKIGATVVVPFRGRHAIKVGYSRGVVTEFGEDFRQLLLSYSLVFR